MMAPNVNRIALALTRVKDQIESSGKTTEDLEALSKSLDLRHDEHARFQTLKSQVMGQILTLEEATTLYSLLGGAPSVFNDQPIHVKVVLTKTFAELLAAVVGAPPAR